MRTYLSQFIPYSEDRRAYPYRVIYPMHLDCVNFAPITILYGNNGSGKSTLLNVIARNIGIKNMTLGNDNEYFDGYIQKCSSSISPEGIPEDSALIRSEDIMVKIARQRKLYAGIKNSILSKDILRGSGISKSLVHKALKDPEAVSAKDYALMSRFEDFRTAKLELGNDDATSNGEKALEYFEENLFDESLYLLDEPENSMAPAFQQKLAKHIELLAYQLDTQFVIATHSPFLLSIDGARIYDLDSRPSREKARYELENMKAYYSLFKRFEDKFAGKRQTMSKNTNLI